MLYEVLWHVVFLWNWLNLIIVWLIKSKECLLKYDLCLMEQLSKLEAWSDSALTWWVLFSRMTVGVSVLLCCLGLGGVGFFFVKTRYKCPVLLLPRLCFLSLGKDGGSLEGKERYQGIQTKKKHCPGSSQIKGVTEMGDHSYRYYCLYFFTDPDSHNKLCDQAPMLYLHTTKLGLDFWLCFFFLQLSSSSHIALCCKEKTL